MELTEKMHQAAVRVAVERGLIPKISADEATYLRNWDNIRAIVQAALDASVVGPAATMRAPVIYYDQCEANDAKCVGLFYPIGDEKWHAGDECPRCRNELREAPSLDEIRGS